MQFAYQHGIRALRPADLDAILAVQAACYPPSMQEAGEVVLARMGLAGDSCVVAEDEDGVCAYLFAYPSRLGRVTPLGAQFEPTANADTLYLHDLAVAPRAHGRGLARSLVGHLLAQARRQGFSSSALVSVQDTAAFWSGLGYRPAEADGPAARAALASYPGQARYMVRALDA
ncbi:MAG: GNAT family N-acetyltransferase [Janthinobacterium lividum]